MNNYVITDRTGKRFFGGRPELARSKDGGLRGAWHCFLFNAPSTYASMAMVQRLASIVQAHRFPSDLFSKVLEQPPRL
jgi:hypothetical protein